MSFLYTDASVASLSAGQAAGTTAILVTDTLRKQLMINPPADCTLKIATGATGGYPLFGGIANTLTDAECPQNDIFITGLTAGQALTIWKA